MVKPCRIDDTVCVQLCREVIVSILVPEGLFVSASRRAVQVTVRVLWVLPKGCPRHRPGDCSTASRRAVRGADEGVHPRGWEVVNPSCGDLHRRSSSTLLLAALRVGNEYDQTLYAVSIVVLGWCVGRKIFVFCCVTLQRPLANQGKRRLGNK